jgi:hypothetical protein
MSDLGNAADRGKDKDTPSDLTDLTKDTGDKEPTTRFTVDLPDSLHKRFKVAAAEDDQTMKDLMVTALQRYLEQR